MNKTIIPTRRREKAASINQSRWLAYATAGAATALACANSAEGDITYSGPINRSFTTPPAGQSTFQHFALAGSIELDFQLVNIVGGPYGTGGVAHFRLGPQGFYPGAATQVVGSRGSLAPNAATIYLSRLGFGQNLANQHFTAFQHYPITTSEPDGRAYFGTMAAYSGFPHSHWASAGLTGFIGFKFDAGKGTQYGWAQIRMDSGPSANTYTLIDYAFADPGESLSTGQVPEPSSLGLLALGGGGVLAWRKRRANKKEKQAT